MSFLQAPSNQTVGFAVLLMALTLINVLFFRGYHREPVLKCTTDALMLVAGQYILDGGQDIVQFVPKQCQEPRDDIMLELSTAVGALVQECRLENANVRAFERFPLITLFTTHADHKHGDDQNMLVHNNTLVNWSMLKPKARLVLFTNDSSWEELAISNGWDVLPIVENSTSHAPSLKSMFEAVAAKYDSIWYGYANADILFTDNLMSTLEAISAQFYVDQFEKRILVTGRRTDVKGVTSADASSWESLHQAASTRGELYRIDAEDFFLTTRAFPWKDILPVVVGRRAYDNWIVSHARCALETTVIDVTGTVTAVHQTLAEGEEDTWARPEIQYNNELLENRAKDPPNYVAGLTNCIEFKTFTSHCGSIRTTMRHTLGGNCRCRP